MSLAIPRQPRGNRPGYRGVARILAAGGGRNDSLPLPPLGWNFRDLFVPHDPRVATLANYGIAAVAYLIAGRLAAAVIRRLG